MATKKKPQVVKKAAKKTAVKKLIESKPLPIAESEACYDEHPREKSLAEDPEVWAQVRAAREEGHGAGYRQGLREKDEFAKSITDNPYHTCLYTQGEMKKIDDEIAVLEERIASLRNDFNRHSINLESMKKMIALQINYE